MLNMSNTIP